MDVIVIVSYSLPLFLHDETPHLSVPWTNDARALIARSIFSITSQGCKDQAEWCITRCITKAISQVLRTVER